MNHVAAMVTGSLSRIRAILFKELRQLSRDRMTFGMVIMIPLVQLVLFGFAINTNVRDIPVGVVDQAQSGLSRGLLQLVSATRVVRITHHFDNVKEAENAMERTDVRAVLVIPEDLPQRVARHPSLANGTPPSSDWVISRPLAGWIVDGSDTLIAGAIKSLGNMPLTELQGKPANRNVPTFAVALYYNPEQRTAVNIVPGLVGIILTMTMIMFTSAAIVRERERGNLEMLITTPVHSLELMLGKIVPYILIGLVQVMIILGLGHLIFDVPLNGGIGALLLATLLFISASLVLGLVISTVAKTQLQSMQMTVFVLLPSILLSGYMFPFEGMPLAAQYIAEALPATHFMRLIRGVVLKDADVLAMTWDMGFLLGFTVLGLLLASVRFRKQLD